MTSSPGHERALSDRLAQGDRRALAELYRMHAGVLLSLLLKMVRNRAEAEELVQETFLDAWRRASHYDASRANVLSWLVVIAKSRAIDRLRNRSASTRALEASTSGRTQSDEGDLASALHVQRNVVALREALAQLPENQRELIELAWDAGLSQSEIAQKTGLPLGTVKTRTRQALLRLSDSVQK